MENIVQLEFTFHFKRLSAARTRASGPVRRLARRHNLPFAHAAIYADLIGIDKEGTRYECE
jgi:hypothetical protein